MATVAPGVAMVPRRKTERAELHPIGDAREKEEEDQAPGELNGACPLISS